MLTLITAQHFESLQHRLLAKLMQPDDDPLRADPVLVPSTALRRALSLAIADAHQVCAQVEFSFLAQWLWAQMARVVPDIPAQSPFDPDCLRWRLLRLLDNPALAAGHVRLQTYLAGADPVMRFDLAGQLASLFDQYITYRQDWLAAWAGGQRVAAHPSDPVGRADEAWQAALWRAVLADLQSPGSRAAAGHPVQRFLAALAAAGPHTPSLHGLPKAVHVFCVPTMPPLYLQVLEGLAEHIDVTLYVLDPSLEYWHDTVSQRYLAERLVRGNDGSYEVGHRLLSAWGRQTQSFLQLLLDRDTLRQEISLDGCAMPSSTLLGAVQQGIVSLQDLVPGSLHGQVCADGSLQVHVCHGLMRELEVLHDHLLHCFVADPTLRPEDVLVVLPDLEGAAPLIEAVFGAEGAAGTSRRSLPFAITGLAPAASSATVQALLAVLDYARSRMPLSGLLELLQQPLLAAGLGLTTVQVDTLAAQLRAAHVHWGMDDAHLASLQLPAAAGHTLQAGLERLMLGHALPDEHPGLWLGMLPAGNVEGSDALLLAVLQECLARLTQLRTLLAGALTPAEWFRLLDQVLRVWLPQGQGAAAELTALRVDLQAQHAALQAAAMTAPLPAEVLLRALQDHLQGHASGGVATGAITFAAMASLRTLPFRHVCVLGLDDGVFPSTRRPLDFDLLSAYPALGDRQRGEDERNLFLDLMLAARARLYLSYSGRSARDDSVRPPSILLAELLDALVPALCAEGATEHERSRQRAALVTLHALQPFDLRYFQAGASAAAVAAGGSASASTPPAAALPRSFQAVYAAALRQRDAAVSLRPALAGAPPDVGAGAPLPGAAGPLAWTGLPAEDDEAGEMLEGENNGEDEDLASPGEPAFFTAPLPPPEAEWRAVQLDQLVQFFRHPARFLLRRRLGLALPAPEDQWEDAEDFLPAFQAPQQLARRLLPALLSGVPLAELTAVAAAGSEFPAGALGDSARATALGQLGQFARRIAAATSAPRQPARSGSLTFHLHDETWQLSGTSARLHATQVDWRFHALWPGDELEVWIRHLWLCALAGQDGQPAALPAMFLFSDHTLQFAALAPAQAMAHLTVLMRCYRHGLQQPLHFYPKTARARVIKDSHAAALGKWQKGFGDRPGEGEDAAWRLALRGVAEPLDADFVTLADLIWRPLLEAAR